MLEIIYQDDHVIVVQDSQGRIIRLVDHGEGITVENKGGKNGTRAIYSNKRFRDVLLFSDASPKNCWKDYEVLIS